MNTLDNQFVFDENYFRLVATGKKLVDEQGGF